MTFTKLDGLFCSFLELSITQWTIVKAIWQNDAISATDIIEHYFSNHPNMSRASLQVALAKVRAKLALRGILISTVYKFGYVMSGDGKAELERLENIFKRRLGTNEKIEEDENY